MGLLPAGIQVKLLRVLQENQFFRIGGQKQIEVNVRVICANNADLHALVKNGRFREDLYYRLNICEIRIPPLRERPDDVAVLTAHFLERYNRSYKLQKRFASASMGAMLAYEWPGNVRELENAVHRLVIGSKGDFIEVEDVCRALNRHPSVGGADAPAGRVPRVEDGGLAHSVTQYERALIEDALKRWKSTRKAAAQLGVSQSQLMRKKRKYNIETE